VILSVPLTNCSNDLVFLTETRVGYNTDIHTIGPFHYHRICRPISKKINRHFGGLAILRKNYTQDYPCQVPWYMPSHYVDNTLSIYTIHLRNQKKYLSNLTHWNSGLVFFNWKMPIKTSINTSIKMCFWNIGRLKSKSNDKTADPIFF
jgi:hypothetical protein